MSNQVCLMDYEFKKIYSNIFLMYLLPHNLNKIRLKVLNFNAGHSTQVILSEIQIIFSPRFKSFLMFQSSLFAFNEWTDVKGCLL